MDANGGIFPVAFGVIDNENVANWEWFLRHLKWALLSVLAAAVIAAFVFLSNRQKGLVETIKAVFPGCPHGFCMHNPAENFCKKVKNVQLVELLWKATRESTRDLFEENMGKIREIDSGAYDWLMDLADPVHWAEAFLQGKRYGHLLLRHSMHGSLKHRINQQGIC